MGDEETAVHIMSEADPGRQKGLARNIKGDIQKWTLDANTITYNTGICYKKKNFIFSPSTYLVEGTAVRDQNWCR